MILHGANINAQCDGGSTALHYCANCNSKETAELLILHGAEINSKNNKGDIPLHIATQKNN